MGNTNQSQHYSCLRRAPWLRIPCLFCPQQSICSSAFYHVSSMWILSELNISFSMSTSVSSVSDCKQLRTAALLMLKSNRSDRAVWIEPSEHGRVQAYTWYKMWHHCSTNRLVWFLTVAAEYSQIWGYCSFNLWYRNKVCYCLGYEMAILYLSCCP